MNRLLIFDMDDTIFETKSISPAKIQPILDSFRSEAIKDYEEAEVNMIIAALWRNPFDDVAAKYHFSEQIKTNFAKNIAATDFEFDIKPFEDYALTKNIPGSRYLVTTGFKKFQEAKIKALKLDFDPMKIFIDDILQPDRIGKIGLFKNIIAQENTPLDAIHVIGDNPNSELKAGFQLGLNTIQIAKFGQERSSYSKHYITGYDELSICL